MNSGNATQQSKTRYQLQVEAVRAIESGDRTIYRGIAAIQETRIEHEVMEVLRHAQAEWASGRWGRSRSRSG